MPWNGMCGTVPVSRSKFGGQGLILCAETWLQRGTQSLWNLILWTEAIHTLEIREDREDSFF